MSTIEVEVQVEFRPGRRFLAFQDAIFRLSQDKQFLGELVAEVARESILKAIAERFLAKEADMTNTEKVGGGTSDKVTMARLAVSVRGLQRELNELAQGGQKLTESQTSQKEKLLTRIKKLHARMWGSGNAKTAAGDEIDPTSGLAIAAGAKGSLSTGQFKVRMLQLYTMLANPARIAFQPTSDGVVVGIGNTSMMNTVRTPSHGELEGKKRPTTSDFTVMWRQLEFGSGIYAKGGKRVKGPTKSKGGGGRWWYGPAIDSGVQLRGARPGNFFTMTDGSPYNSDMLRFQNRFALQMQQLLTGTGGG